MDYPIQYTFQGFNNFLSRQHQLQLLEREGSLPFHHRHETMVRDSVDDVLGRVSTIQGLSVYRFDSDELIATTESAVVRLHAYARAPLVACTLEVWASALGSGERLVQSLKERLGPSAQGPRVLSVDWYFPLERSFTSVHLNEQVDERLSPLAYPWLPTGLERFTERFLSATEPVFVLYGPPGSGKTRLIRHLLASLSAHRGKPAKILYTSDGQTVEREQFFVDFLSTPYDAMVIEDADYMLEPRSAGNRHLHRFLGASDGLLQPRGRRMIFSTNLPSRLDIDEALVRPGRCFGCVGSRKLEAPEVLALLDDIAPEPGVRARTLMQLRERRLEKLSLAEVYAAVRHAEVTHDGQELSQVA